MPSDAKVPYFRGRPVSALTDAECRTALIRCIELLDQEKQWTRTVFSVSQALVGVGLPSVDPGRERDSGE